MLTLTKTPVDTTKPELYRDSILAIKARLKLLAAEIKELKPVGKRCQQIDQLCYEEHGHNYAAYNPELKQERSLLMDQLYRPSVWYSRSTEFTVLLNLYHLVRGKSHRHRCDRYPYEARTAYRALSAWLEETYGLEIDEEQERELFS